MRNTFSYLLLTTAHQDTAFNSRLKRKEHVYLTGCHNPVGPGHLFYSSS